MNSLNRHIFSVFETWQVNLPAPINTDYYQILLNSLNTAIEVLNFSNTLLENHGEPWIAMPAESYICV